jgi:hypothetical protein
MKWVTRERPVIDRIACPWLIARFIDKDPEFLFAPPDQVVRVAEETGATPYDVPNVEFTISAMAAASTPSSPNTASTATRRSQPSPPSCAAPTPTGTT